MSEKLNTYEVYLFNGNRTVQVVALGFMIDGRYTVFLGAGGERVACFHDATSVAKHGVTA